MAENILEVHDLEIRYVTDEETVQAVNDITFSLERGESIGLVGETGAGKTTTALGIMGLVPDPPGEIVKGSILFEGEDLLKLSEKQMRRIRGGKISMIFQDPMTSLNPTMKVGKQIEEMLKEHRKEMSKADRKTRAIELLSLVGISNPEARYDQYPHQLSGGMRQRVVIAIALACDPKVLIADEPTTALDVTIQAQVINLLEQLQRERGLTYLFIAHDLSMVKHISDRIGVMYLGSLVELADSEELFENPMHPYTKALLSAIPIPDPDIEKNRQRIMLEGTLPNPIDLGEECKFCSRCPVCKDSCHKSQPKLVEVKPGHFVACSQCAE